MKAQMTFEEIDEKYKAFVDKFKPKKTTDDCYTPENVFNAVKDWVVKEYNIDQEKIVRPFWPGGDYEKESYPEGCVVLDNPPFSIITKIVNKYMAEGINFFLFAPHLTNFSIASGRKDVCRIICNSSITYENGAEVNTSFVTNLDKWLIRTAPELRAAVEREDAINRRNKVKELPRYVYPKNVITAAIVGAIARYGVEFNVPPDEAEFVRCLDDQKAYDKALFGGGYLISNRMAAERQAAERQAAELAGGAYEWKLSPRELEAIKALEGE